ncbi:MAG: stage II sporulation protein M, partial [Candidatus Micrarchaeota archaeon]
EKRQEYRCKGGLTSIFTCYGRLIRFYGYFFIGTALGFAFCAAILPEDISSAMFLAQKNEYTNILQLSSKVTAQAEGLSFGGIFLHNLEVLALMLVFSFIYSIGSIFLLVWNASLVGIFLESYIRESFLTYAKFGIFGFPAAFLMGSFSGLLRLLPHGIFEISAFFMASISGGILSVAIERRMYRKSNIKEIAIDVAAFFLFSVLLLAIGALVESSIIFGAIS